MRARLRMGVNRPWMTVSLRLPVDLVDDLKEIAPMLGWTRYTTAMRGYIGRGLDEDCDWLLDSPAAKLTESLRANGVADEVIADAVRAAGLQIRTSRRPLTGRLLL